MTLSKKKITKGTIANEKRPVPAVQVEDDGALQVQLAWAALRDDILSGKLAPLTKLRIAMLKKRYEIGASPLREALSRLVSENLVISVDRRGFMVSPMSLADFRDLTNLRKLLEKEALRLSFELGDESWEAKFLAAYHQLARVQERVDAANPASVAEWEVYNRRYHDALVSACGSDWLLRTRESIYLCAARYRRMCLSIRHIPRDVQKEHRMIRDAALERDIEKASLLIDEHLERTYQKVAESGLAPK